MPAAAHHFWTRFRRLSAVLKGLPAAVSRYVAPWTFWARAAFRSGGSIGIETGALPFLPG